jgi:LDH2 family malate/lactate/ureidoglycolate dehydrogenase
MSEAGAVVVPAETLAKLVAELFVATGVSPQAAQAVAEGLVEADLHGLQSHGVMLTDLYIARLRAGSVSRRVSAQRISDRGATVVLDAGHALGHITGAEAMSIAVEKAQEHGAGIVAVRHGFHFGAARRFAVQAAEADCIGIVCCNTRPLMPAPGGAEAVVGNNPLAIAIPTDDPVPLVLDMATSEAAMGKIRMAHKSGDTIPPGWAVDTQGVPTMDAGAAISGMLLPTGGPKGFGLALMIDLVAGLLSGGAAGAAVRPLYNNDAEPYDCSHVFMAISLTHFGNPAAMRKRVAEYTRRIRLSRKAPGVERLFSPGEPEWERRRRAEGHVALPPPVASMLSRLASELGIDTGVLSNHAN